MAGKNIKIFRADFFNRPTLLVARELLGKFLVRKINGRIISGRITEVEAYIGSKDKASHALRGKTLRTEVMFGKAGHWYVYLIYGIYCCLNIVTEKEGYPAAVLVRSVDHTSGPGRVCKKFEITRGLNKKLADKASGLWIEDRGAEARPSQIKRGKRIGVDYAGEWKDRPWRFYLK